MRCMLLRMLEVLEVMSCMLLVCWMLQRGAQFQGVEIFVAEFFASQTRLENVRLEHVVTSSNSGNPTNISDMSPEGAANNCGCPATLSEPYLGANSLTLAGVPLVQRRRTPFDERKMGTGCRKITEEPSAPGLYLLIISTDLHPTPYMVSRSQRHCSGQTPDFLQRGQPATSSISCRRRENSQP